MAVLVEAISLIVRAERIDLTIGWDAFMEMIPNQTFCSDGLLARVGFMTPDSTRAFVEDLEQAGMRYLAGSRAMDMCVVDQQFGPMARARWLDVGHVTIDGHEVAAAQLRGYEIPRIYVPEEWRYEESLSRSFGFIPTSEMHRVRVIASQDGLDTVITPLSDKPMYIANTKRRISHNLTASPAPGARDAED